MNRTAHVERTTSETTVTIDIDLDGAGKATVSTGVPFFDHLLVSLSHHSMIDMAVSTDGDLDVDDHHTVEDTALALGTAISDALGDRVGIVRFGAASVPMDESIATCVVDLSGRTYAVLDIPLLQPKIGTLSTQNVPHALEAFARTAGATIHLRSQGRNDHHVAEAAFKALARSLRAAVEIDPRRVGVPSTKGVL